MCSRGKIVGAHRPFERCTAANRPHHSVVCHHVCHHCGRSRRWRPTQTTVTTDRRLPSRVSNVRGGSRDSAPRPPSPLTVDYPHVCQVSMEAADARRRDHRHHSPTSAIVCGQVSVEAAEARHRRCHHLHGQCCRSRSSAVTPHAPVSSHSDACHHVYQVFMEAAEARHRDRRHH